MNRPQFLTGLGLPFVLLLLGATSIAPGYAAQVNGVFSVSSAEIIDLYSATFDGAIDPNCAGAPDPGECAFFSGKAPATRAIVINNQVPSTSTGTLDVQYDDVTGEIIQVNNLFIQLSDLQLVIQNNTFVTVTQGNAFPAANDAIFIEGGLNSASGTADPDESLAGLGPTVFEHDDAPQADVPDFATFNDIVDVCDNGAGGPGSLCGLIGILTLDGIRYRIVGTVSPGGLDSFQLQTQTANNSIYKVDFATAAPPVPEITVTDSVAPANDLSIPFGSVAELATVNRTVTVRNDGTAALVIGNLAVADALAPPFSLSNDLCSGQSITAAASCTVTVTFAPTATGPFNDTFDIPSNDADEATVTVTVSGTGTALPVPDIEVEDSIAPIDDLEIGFGNITINQSATPATLTVANNGTAPLNIGQIAPLTAPFAITGDTCSNTADPAAGNCSLMVSFMPTVEGAAADDLDIPSDDPDSATVTVAVTGTGAPLPTPDISVVPATLTFGNVTIGNVLIQTVSVTNDGSAALTLGQVGVAIPLAAPFSLVMDSCSGQVLAPMATCTFDVVFSPTAVGAANDSLDVPSDDPDEATVNVAVSGTGANVLVSQTPPTDPAGSDSGFFGLAADPWSLAALMLLLVTVELRRRRRQVVRATNR